MVLSNGIRLWNLDDGNVVFVPLDPYDVAHELDYLFGQVKCARAPKIL